MKIKKVNIGLSLARNYNKITLDFLEEEIEYETEGELKANIRQRFNILREEIELQFSKIETQNEK